MVTASSPLKRPNKEKELRYPKHTIFGYLFKPIDGERSSKHGNPKENQAKRAKTQSIKNLFLTAFPSKG